jgi:hypothetical protein
VEVVLRLSPTGFCCATFFASEVLRASTVHQEALLVQHFRKVRPDLCRSRIRVSGCPGWSPQTMPSDCKRWHIIFSIFWSFFYLSFSQKFISSAFWIVAVKKLPLKIVFHSIFYLEVLRPVNCCVAAIAWLAAAARGLAPPKWPKAGNTLGVLGPGVPKLPAPIEFNPTLAEELEIDWKEYI